MYPYDFEPKQKAINFNEIFVVMPFDDKFDFIYDDLIVPATAKANEILAGAHAVLQAYRTKDDIRTQSGWMNVLEHLSGAQIVLGVLTSDNPNVFYELGIAHATQPMARQILIANKGYAPKFDTKDLIYYEYGDNVIAGVDGLADKISDAVKWYKIEDEKKIKRARMMIGPYEFEIIMNWCANSHFEVHTSQGKEEYENKFKKSHGEEFAKGVFDRHMVAIANLCSQGLLGLNTESKQENNSIKIYFSYWWTELGNSLLHMMKLIDVNELHKRRNALPKFFR